VQATWLSYLFVALGGALGAVARFGLNVMLQRDHLWPWGTFSANLIGCFLMGAIAHLVAASDWFNTGGLIPDQYRLLFAVGFCGSFTTLSALVLEMHTLFVRGEMVTSALYLGLTMAGGVLLFLLGYQLAKPLI